MDTDLPDPLAARLEGESALAGVSLGGEDLLIVTPSRTLVYRAEGLLREESVEAYPHEMDRLACSEGRRKATVRMQYIDGPREFSVAADRLDEVLEAVLAGVLAATGVTDGDEEIEGVFRFSELTLIVTGRRVVKHVGAAVWGDDHEQYPFADVTDLAVEEGTVSAQVVLTVDGRPQRVKAPAEEARRVRRTLENALLAFHGAGSIEELRERFADEDEGEDGDETTDATAESVDGIDAVGGGAANDTGDTGADDGDGDDEAGTATAPASDGARARADAEVLERLDALERAVERQSKRIDEQRETIERLVEELRRGR
jgi:hypothetical protein